MWRNACKRFFYFIIIMQISLKRSSLLKLQITTTTTALWWWKMDKSIKIRIKMLPLPLYMKNIRRLVIILAVLLLYISMYLIHNAYGGTLCIIKSADDNKGTEQGDNIQEASRLLYKVNESNLFAVSNVQFLCCLIFCNFFSLSLSIIDKGWVLFQINN